MNAELQPLLHEVALAVLMDNPEMGGEGEFQRGAQTFAFALNAWGLYKETTFEGVGGAWLAARDRRVKAEALREVGVTLTESILPGFSKKYPTVAERDAYVASRFDARALACAEADRIEGES